MQHNRKPASEKTVGALEAVMRRARFAKLTLAMTQSEAERDCLAYAREYQHKISARTIDAVVAHVFGNDEQAAA